MRTIYMNPGDEEFMEDDPLANQSWSEESRDRTDGRLRERARRFSNTAGDTWEQAREKANVARERTEIFLRENPVPTILGALAIGLAIGLAIRYASRAEEEEAETKAPLGNLNWGFLSLPFLWPLVKSAREKYQESANALKSGAGRLRKIDIDRYAKPIRKRWKALTD
jgi:ElaB/YqjD/DUF883 family membrane-anchored ribosome-binding protein